MRVFYIINGILKRSLFSIEFEYSLDRYGDIEYTSSPVIMSNEGVTYMIVGPDYLFRTPNAVDDYVIIYGKKSEYSSEFISTLTRFGDNVKWV